MFCPYCGSQLNDGSEFCSTCGSKLNAQQPEPPQEVQAANGGMPMVNAGAEMPSVGGNPAAAESPAIPRPGNTAVFGSSVPYPAGSSIPNMVNDLPGSQSTSVLTGITPSPFPGNDPTGAPDLMGITPPPFPGSNPTGAPGSQPTPDPMGAQMNTFTEIPPSFGQPQPAISAVKPMKKNKTPLIIVLIIVGVILLGGIGAFFITLSNGYLYRSGGVKAIYDVTHLCIQHHYLDADCENPERCEICGNGQGAALGHEWTQATCTIASTCSVCGKTNGDPLPHTWTEATCTTSKTCSVCGCSEGEPLGHTTHLGKCSRCGEKITELESLFYEILNIAGDGDSYYQIGYDYFDYSDTSIVSYYIACLNAVPYYTRAAEKYREAAAKCGDYEELSELKMYLNRMADYLPTLEPDATVSDIDDFLDDMVDYSYACQDYARCALDILDLL